MSSLILTMSNVHFEPGMIHSPNHGLQVIGNTGKRIDVFRRMLQTVVMMRQTHHLWLNVKKHKTRAQTIDNFHFQLIYPDAKGDNSPKHNDIQNTLTYKAAKSHMGEAESRPCSMFWQKKKKKKKKKRCWMKKKQFFKVLTILLDLMFQYY